MQVYGRSCISRAGALLYISPDVLWQLTIVAVKEWVGCWLAMMLNAARRRRLYVDCRQWFQSLPVTAKGAAVIYARRQCRHPGVIVDILTPAKRGRRPLLPVIAFQDSLTSLSQVLQTQTAACHCCRGWRTTGRSGTLIDRGRCQHSAVWRWGRTGL